MNFWDKVKSFFGGGNQRKRREEEDRAPRQTQQRQRVQTRRQQFGGLENNEREKTPSVKEQVNLFGTLNNSKPQTPAPKPTPAPTPTQELESLTQKNMDQSLKELTRNQNLFERGVNTITGSNRRIAAQNARNKAVNQYQEKRGWKPSAEVDKFQGNTVDLTKRNTEKIKTQGKNLNKFEKGAYKAAQVAQYVPVTGSVLNVGLAAAEKAGNKDMREVRNKIDFGMTNKEFDKLDAETQRKLKTVQNIGLALSPLDFLGLGGLAKSTGLSAAKKGATQLVKDRSIDAATRSALKSSAKGAIKSSIPAAAIGTGASAGIQGYLTGEVDPLEALKAGAMVGGTSMLIPNGSRVMADAAEGPTNTMRGAMLGMADRAGIPVEGPRSYTRQVDVNTVNPLVRRIDDTVTGRPNEVQLPTPIREFPGDTPGASRVTPETRAAEVRARFEAQPTARPDRTVEGMLPRRVEDTTLYTKAEVDAERAALDQALANKKINKTAHKAATAELDSLPLSDAPTASRQIEVKQVRDIPVDDDVSMPDPVINKVETPKPAKASRSIKVESEPSQVELPADVQQVLDNPRRFNKRQVQAARNQRKLAKQMATAKEQTAEFVDRIDVASPEAQTGAGIVPTGELGKGRNGNIYQKSSRATEQAAAIQETANLSPSEVIRQARTSSAETGGGFTRRDIRNVAALFETKRLERGSPEWNEARQILKEDGTNWGQQGALRNHTIRRTASADELISRFESKLYRLADDPSKIDSRLFDEIDAAETAFVDARDAATSAFNKFTEDPTPANTKAYHAAQDAADKAEFDAKVTEFRVAEQALKGNKDIKQVRELEKMAQEADIYKMDSVDASMLSGTGTFVRNFFNASVGGVEEAVFGKAASKLASLTPNARKNDVRVGGGLGRGSIKGLKEGSQNLVKVASARKNIAGKNPLEHIKNWATTGNQLGDAVIDAQASRGTLDHYTQMLKSQGFKGQELRNRASVMARQDPDGVRSVYNGAARMAAGLGDGTNVASRSRIEADFAHKLSDMLSGGNPTATTDTIAKTAMRMTMGFPTAIARSTIEGGKRAMLGAPTFFKAMRTTDPVQRAILVKEGIKQAGTGGMVIPPLFLALGASGAITGGYPSDKAERERWEREGITENSLKIGDDYYQLPAYLGAWAVPGLFYAAMGRNGGDMTAALEEMKTVIPALLPTDQMSSVMDAINGRSDLAKFGVQMGAGAVRALTPAGALLNQIGKMIDPTQNETSDGEPLENLVSKIINGVPGLNLMLDAKTDADGNELQNPDPLALGFGAASTEQQAGVERSEELNEQTNSRIDTLDQYGAFGDPNLEKMITDSATKKLYQKIMDGEQVNPEDLNKVQKAMVKGVSDSGTDTSYLENEQYDTHLAALQLKRDLMASEPNVKPSKLEKMDLAIRRGEIYRDNQVPYDTIKGYQKTSLTEWRKMGDPDSDEYNPEMYQTLWALDELMAQNNASYDSDRSDQQKYYAKSSKRGGGGGGGRGRGGKVEKIGTDFGTLKAGTGAPSVQEYASISSQGGNGVPVIQRERPNIVHKIGFSG